MVFAKGIENGFFFPARTGANQHRNQQLNRIFHKVELNAIGLPQLLILTLPKLEQGLDLFI